MQRFLVNRNILHVAFVVALIATCVACVACVPTSVLVQNSELAAAANGPNPIGQKQSVLMAKVKRSSPAGKDANTLESTTNAGGIPAMNKKSSPEIVPPSFDSPAMNSQQPLQQQPAGPQQLQQQQQQSVATSSEGFVLPTDEEILSSAIAAGLTAAAYTGSHPASGLYGSANGNDDELYQDAAPMMHKRGINTQQYLYGLNGPMLNDLSGYGGSNPYAGSYAAPAIVPPGVWADEMDPTIVYTDLPDIDEYAPASRAAYRNKAYDNLQNLLNAEAYLEPVVMPSVQQYPARRFYNMMGGGGGEHQKRFNMNRYNKFSDMRPKRDTKLTPADMLALVALVEAGERARVDSDAADSTWMDSEINPKAYNGKANQAYNYNNGYDYPAAGDDMDYNALGSTWFDPAVVDYYNAPLETIPKYELTREHKYGSNNNRYPSSKRFMVAKKKRSLGKFLNEPVAKPSFSFNASPNDKYFK